MRTRTRTTRNRASPGIRGMVESPSRRSSRTREGAGRRVLAMGSVMAEEEAVGPDLPQEAPGGEREEEDQVEEEE